MSVEHWDELPIDELRTRIAELEAWKASATVMLEHYRKSLAFGVEPTISTRRKHLAACSALIRGDALLPKETSNTQTVKAVDGSV